MDVFESEYVGDTPLLNRIDRTARACEQLR